MFIDTHVHLNDNLIYPKLDEVMNKAKENNVKLFFCVGFDLESSKLAIEIAHKYNDVYAIIGFHPSEIKGYSDSEFNWLDSAASDPKVKAIGEIGYDFHWDTTTKEEQEYAFKRQIEIAIKHNLPVSIHSRDAIELTYETLKECHADIVGGVIHSYSGSYEFAPNFLKLGFYLGISGPVTFKNGRVMKEVVEHVSLDRLISETDSPYLTPHPFRGRENSPEYIPLIVEEISRIKNIDIKEVEKQIENNVSKLFKIEGITDEK